MLMVELLLIITQFTMANGTGDTTVGGTLDVNGATTLILSNTDTLSVKGNSGSDVFTIDGNGKQLFKTTTLASATSLRLNEFIADANNTG